MRVTKHYEHDRVMLYVVEGDTQTGGNTGTNNPPSGDLEP